MKYIQTIILVIACSAVFSACNSKVDTYSETKRDAKIFPLYESTIIPYNIAPLNFRIEEDAKRYVARFVSATDSFEVSASSALSIPPKKWKKMLEANKGGKVEVKLFGQTDNDWEKYNSLVFTIAPEPVDPYVAYRLIDPGYINWKTMGLYQRCIETFEETPILENRMTKNNCMNCHSFHQNNPDHMAFHIRADYAGTIIAKDGDIQKVNTKAPWMISAGVYPRWHPNGQLIAFSSNHTQQGFLSMHTNKIEVFDNESDIVIYDTEKEEIYTNKIIHSKDSYETFPEWSPDGKWLYFCTAPALNMPVDYQDIRYSLVRVPFDEATRTFGTEADTLFSAGTYGKSMSMPRISPDGKHLVFCVFDYGTFPIWHRENDLYIMNLESRELENMADVNSDETDSYHSWSSNGRWLLFSSRRIDGSFTRLYISYIDENGKGHKPFLIPQKRADYYDYQMKSYNVPEFITGKIKTSPVQFFEAAKKDPVIPKS